jgi:hypothetical protein
MEGNYLLGMFQIITLDFQTFPRFRNPAVLNKLFLVLSLVIGWPAWVNQKLK